MDSFTKYYHTQFVLNSIVLHLVEKYLQNLLIFLKTGLMGNLIISKLLKVYYCIKITPMLLYPYGVLIRIKYSNSANIIIEVIDMTMLQITPETIADLKQILQAQKIESTNLRITARIG